MHGWKKRLSFYVCFVGGISTVLNKEIYIWTGLKSPLGRICNNTFCSWTLKCCKKCEKLFAHKDEVMDHKMNEHNRVVCELLPRAVRKEEQSDDCSRMVHTGPVHQYMFCKFMRTVQNSTCFESL